MNNKQMIEALEGRQLLAFDAAGCDISQNCNLSHADLGSFADSVDDFKVAGASQPLIEANPVRAAACLGDVTACAVKVINDTKAATSTKTDIRTALQDLANQLIASINAVNQCNAIITAIGNSAKMLNAEIKGTDTVPGMAFDFNACASTRHSAMITDLITQHNVAVKMKEAATIN